MAQYHDHWDNTNETPTTHLMQLLLVLATGASLYPEIHIGDKGRQPSHGLARRWIEVVESWLLSASSPPPESWPALTIQCLLIIAKRANFLHESALWVTTGATVRWAMAGGYHQEAPPSARISTFHREMRRRLWITIVELDLQASFERGMPPSIKTGDYNTNLPLHIEDDAICETATQPPQQQPLTTWTQTSFQVIFHQSFFIRLKVCSFINSPQDHPHDQADFDHFIRLAEDLAQAIVDLPNWNTTSADFRQRQITTYVERMLSMLLNQYVLILHMPWAIQKSPHFRSRISRNARLDASLVILQQYRRLADDEIIPESACRNGLVLAALNLCHELYLRSESSRKLPRYSPFPGTEIFWECQNINKLDSNDAILALPDIVHSLISVAEQALSLLETRAAAKIEGLNEHYTVSMVIGLLKSKIWPESSSLWSKEAAERVIHVGKLITTSIASNLESW